MSIQNSLRLFFSCLDTLGGLTCFEEKEEEEYINHPYFDICLNLVFFYCHTCTGVRGLILFFLSVTLTIFKFLAIEHC